jgi:nucleoside permease NupC
MNRPMFPLLQNVISAFNAFFLEIFYPYILFSTDKNLFEAISSGAVTSIKLCAYIAVNLIAFVSFLDFVDGTLNWVGERIGIGPPDYLPLSFQVSI